MTRIRAKRLVLKFPAEIFSAIGLILISIAALLVFVPAGIAVAGISCLIFAKAFENDKINPQ